MTNKKIKEGFIKAVKEHKRLQDELWWRLATREDIGDIIRENIKEAVKKERKRLIKVVREYGGICVEGNELADELELLDKKK